MSIVPRNGKVAVVGAGVSGLSFSYFLQKLRPDISISILEAAGEPGGWIRTTKLIDNGNPLLLEKGPRTLRGVSDGSLLIVDIMKQLNKEKDVEVMKSTSVGNRKWLLEPSGKLIQVPNSILLFAKFMTSDVSEGLITSILREPFQKPEKSVDDESIRSFILRRFGSPKLADNVLSAIMHGIYSGDVSKLSVNATLPGLVKLERTDGSIIKSVIKSLSKKKAEVAENHSLAQYEKLISPSAQMARLSDELKKFPIMKIQGGLQEFPRALAEHLTKQNKVTIRYNTPVVGLDLARQSIETPSEVNTYDYIRFTLGFNSLKLVAHTDQKIDAILGQLEYLTIFLANVYSKRGGLIPKNGNGFGFLVPKRNANPESLLGVIFDSDTELDSQRFVDGVPLPKAQYEKITLMIGGHYFLKGVPSNRANLRATKQILKNILGVDLSKYNIIERDEATEASKDVSLGDDDLLISYNLHRDCIPQYNVGYLEHMKEVQQYVAQQSHGRVTLGGPCSGKPGVPDSVMDGLVAALAIR